MELFGHNSPRRREVRKHQPKEPARWERWLHRREVYWAAFWVFTVALVAGVMALSAHNELPFSEGQRARETRLARVDFKAVDEVATSNAKRDAADREPPTYTPNEPFLRFVDSQFEYLYTLANNPAPAQSDLEAIGLDPEGLATLKGFLVDGKPHEGWNDLITTFKRELLKTALLSAEDAQRELDLSLKHPSPKIVLVREGEPDVDVFRRPTEIMSVGDEAALLTTYYQRVERIVQDLGPGMNSLAAPIASLLQQTKVPAFKLSQQIWDQRKAARAALELPIEKRYRKGEPIVVAGQPLTQTDLERLELERDAYEAHVAQVNPTLPVHFMTSLARASLVALVGLAIWAYVLSYSPRIAQNPMRGVAFTGLLLLALGFAVYLTLAYPGFVYATAVAPTLIVGLVLGIVYDRRFAMAIGALHAVLVMLTLNLPLEFGFVLLVGLAVSVGQLNEVRSRSKLLLTGFWAGAAMMIALIVAAFATRPLDAAYQLRFILLDARTTLFTGLATGLLVQGALPAIEKLFRVTTSMTLKELNDGTLPLLRRLAQEAPGTYQHSLRIADMAEAAAEAIGANSLLCKVGAMYHDIGKINKPQYFIENQAGGPSRHQGLSPAMSLLIIVGHVKDGVELAREYRLPPQLRQFIETHHGTTLVEYFYHAAKQQRVDAAEPAPSEFEFRYPGPKPQSKEAAILMLCDAIESASRAMPEPTAARLEALVRTMSQKRLNDGQFDECSITLQDLHKIEVSITKTLIAMYHGRIAYPKDEATAKTVAS